MSKALAGVNAKLHRADTHLADLDTRVDAYLSEPNYRFVGEEAIDEDSGFSYRACYLVIDEYPPDETWGPIIGDAVHNMRSALDHVAWEIASPASRRDHAREVAFPISRPDAAGAPARQLGHIRPEFHAVVNDVQPYRTGDLHHPLWLLNQLWNVDKHRTLHVTTFMFTEHAQDPANFMGYASWTSQTVRPPARRAKMWESWGTINESLEERLAANNAQARDVALGKPDEPETDSTWTIEYPFTNLPLRPVLRNIRRYLAEEVVAPVAALLT